MQNCLNAGCNNAAIFEVIVELIGSDRRLVGYTTPVTFICGDHMDIKYQEFVTEDYWAKLCSAIPPGRPPVRNYSYLVIRDITVKPPSP